MNLQQEINRLVRQAVMEEVNSLSIRATIREQIEAAGVSHDDIKEMIECKNCVHGYFSGSCGFHNLCGAGKCYLCHEQYGGECDEYIEGKPPEGKEPM